MYSFKNLFRIVLDLSLLALAFVFATLIRLEGVSNSSTTIFILQTQLPKILVPILLIKAISLIITGTYSRFWRYADSSEIVQLGKTLLISSAILVLPRLLGKSPQANDLFAISYGVIILDYLLSLILLSALRLSRRYLLQHRKRKSRSALEQAQTLRRTLLIGAGEAALQVAKSIQDHPEQGLEVLAALDDDKKKHGMSLASGVPVKGSTEDLSYWVSELAVDLVIIAIPSANHELKKKLSLLANQSGVEVRTVPGVDQLAGGKVSVEQIRQLSMEDLLGREAVDLHVPEVINFLKGKKVLVTGAGGSIGSELCRQLIGQCEISSLCLLGKGENSIFETLQDLRIRLAESSTEIELQARIADVRDYQRMDYIVKEFKPDVIFHAAAHKHVYMMELNSCEAFDNNVLGSKNIAEIAGRNKVESFVLISTDKAVNPTSIMGSTKNLAEKAVLLVSKKFPNTKFNAVRFGNVLGSRGSVIKVWTEQLKKSQAITVTHKEAIRYFMTIPEASQLVIQAAAQAQNAEILVLDMGTPIKIYELAKQFIRLSGFQEDEVPIEIIGLREGEKLYEELLTSKESVDSQLTEKIFRARIDFQLEDAELEQEINRLSLLSRENNEAELKSELKKLVYEIGNMV